MRLVETLLHRWIWKIFPGLLACLWGTAWASDELSSVELGGKRLNIPSLYIEMINKPIWWLEWFSGLDESSPEVLLKIPSPEVKHAVSGYGRSAQPEEYLRVRLVALKKEEILRHLDVSRFKSLWGGQYHKRGYIVEKDEYSPFFRIYKEVDYPGAWEVLAISPDDTRPSDDIFHIWIARCSQPYREGSFPDCTSYALHEGIAINFRISGRDIAFVPELRRFLLDALRKWERKQ